MKAINVPADFPIPFASSAGGGFIRSIPQASQIGIQDGAASLHDGFPPDNFSPVGAGGVPPFGQDFNGLLFQITSWNQWQEAGGPVYWDSTFSTNIGGYPKGSRLNALSGLADFWVCLVDDNTTNPETGGANWAKVLTTNYYAADTGAANTMVATLAPAPASMAALTGVLVRIKAQFANTTINPTIAFNGLTATTIVNPDGSSLFPGQIAAGAELLMVPDGTNVQLAGGSSRKSSTFTALKTGSGTYTTPIGAKRLRIRMVAGGGGGGGSVNTSNGGAGGAGGDSTFGSTTTKAGNGGGGGLSSGLGGAGGTSSGTGTTGTGTEIIRVPGARGGPGSPTNGSVTNGISGYGGQSPLGGAGAQLLTNNSFTGLVGLAGATNTGSGGSGGAVQSASAQAGGGGCCGEYVEFEIDAPAATYSYAIGVAGTAGTATGTAPVAAGGEGGSGVILIEEIY